MKIGSIFKESNEVEEKSSETPGKSVECRTTSEADIGDSAIARIEKVFNQVFKGKITFQPTLTKDGKWDSLKHVELIVSIEEEFQVRFSIAEAAKVISVEKLTAVLEQKLER